MTRSWRRAPTGWCSCEMGRSSIRRRPAQIRCSPMAQGGERDAARPRSSSRSGQRRYRWPAGRDPVGKAAAAPGVAAADAGAGAAGPDRRCSVLRRGGGLQPGAPAKSAAGLSGLPAAVRRAGWQGHDGRHRCSQEGVRQHRGDWPPVRAHPRLGPVRRIPGAEPGRPLQQPDTRPGAGHYPSGAGQVAVTSGLAQALQVRIGSVLSLPGHHQRVTGIVENPSDLKDQFALVPPSAAGPAQGITVLLDASPAAFSAFRDTFHGQLVWQARGASTQAAVAAGALAVVTVLMVLVSLVAAAAFAVIATRRQRQLGMLAAIGATRRQLQMVMVAGGALVGIIAAVTGAVVGLAAWFVAAPHLQVSAGHRIDRFAVPWPLVGLGMLLAILTAAAAAWWPARAASRVPIVNALSARPLEPRPAHRTAIMAVPLIVLALACLALANQTSGPLIIAGALAMALGISFISPLSIRVLTAAGRRAPVAVRLALRDLARYQARSAAALAAISLALGIAVAIMISLAAATNAADAGNLPANQMQIWIGQPGGNQLVPVRSPAELNALAAAAHRIAGSLGGAAVIPLDMAVNPASKSPADGQQPVVSLNAPEGQAEIG